MENNYNNKQFTPPNELNTAVLFIVFNRLNTTIQVFNEIRKAQPPRLYIASDGDRDDIREEKEKVQAIRDYISKNIDWNCEIKTLFHEKNLGCKYAVSGAIDWFFEHEEMGIILEDDCLPSQSFFWFCENLLFKYENDTRIMLISGYNVQQEWKKEVNDYFFSNLGGIWGWASWKRAWALNDLEMSDIDSFISQNGFVNSLGKKGKRRQKSLLNVRNHNINTWDYPWGYSMHKNNGLACVPAVNLIENIGFGVDATHTTSTIVGSKFKEEICFPLRHDNFIMPDEIYDDMFFKKSNYMKKMIKKIYSAYRLFRGLIPFSAKSRVWQKREYFDEIWKLRIKKMATYFDENDQKVCDFGCGEEWLKEYLSKDIKYYGVDYTKRNEKVIVCDLNKFELPESHIYNDVVFCSGVLEYIEDLEWFVNSITKHAKKIIISYCRIEEFPNIGARRKLAWKNDYDFKSLDAIFNTNGFKLVGTDIINKNSIACFIKCT